MKPIGGLLRKLRALFLLCAVVATAAAIGYWYGQKSSFAERWHYRLAITPEGQITGRLKELIAQGEGAIPALVLAMDLPREMVAAEVRQVVHEQLTEWRKLRRPDADRRLSTLAAALAEQAESFGPASRAAAAEFVVEILRWNEDGEVANRMSLLASCERVLQICAPQGSAVAEKLKADEADAAKKNHGLDINAHFAGISMQPQKTVLPGGGLGLDKESTASDAGNEGNVPAHSATSDKTEPHRLASDQVERSTRIEDRPLRTASATDGGASPTQDTGTGSSDDRTARATQSAANQFASLLHNQNVVELCGMLHSEELQILEGAATELKRRGVTLRHIELGKHLTDPDPKERRRWAELLPRMSGIDAKPWLLYLSRDQDADVRLAVVTLMATSGDPDMQSRVGQMGRDDDDPRIQGMAVRFSEGARATRR